MNVAVLQHQDDAPAGLIIDALACADASWQTVHLDRGESLPAPGDVQLAVSLGSDAAANDTGVDWVTRELAWLEEADRAGVAILGLCFGGQALAVALGGGVVRGACAERGWVRIESSEPALISPGPWLTWHDDVIALPPRGELLAYNECGPQAFRCGRHLGVQFHPEVTPDIVEDWVRGSREGGLDRDAILAGVRSEFGRAQANARRLFDEVIAGARSPVR